MSYSIAATLQVPSEEGIAKAEAALKEKGFGIISRIDIQAALKSKTGSTSDPSGSSAPGILPSPLRR